MLRCLRHTLLKQAHIKPVHTGKFLALRLSRRFRTAQTSLSCSRRNCLATDVLCDNFVPAASHNVSAKPRIPLERTFLCPLAAVLQQLSPVTQLVCASRNVFYQLLYGCRPTATSYKHVVCQTLSVSFPIHCRLPARPLPTPACPLSTTCLFTGHCLPVHSLLPAYLLSIDCLFTACLSSACWLLHPLCLMFASYLIPIYLFKC